MEDSKSLLPYSNMADCYEALGDYRKAIECYEKDLKLFPGILILEGNRQLYAYLGGSTKGRGGVQPYPTKMDDCHSRMGICGFTRE